MTNFKEKLTIKRHYLVFEERDMVELINVLNAHNVWYVNRNLAIGNCGWAKYPLMWYMHFNANEDQWSSMITELNSRGFDLVIKNRPKDVFVIRR